MGRENKEVGAMPTCYCLNFMCCQPCLPNFQCFQSFVAYTLLHFLLFQLCRNLRNISLGGCILGKSNVLITVGWVWWRHQRAPFLVLPQAPPNPKPTTGYKAPAARLQLVFAALCWSNNIVAQRFSTAVLRELLYMPQ